MLARAVAFVLPLLIIQPAFAIHIYANYSCKSKAGLRLEYDGPGSNYAVGGFSNIYLKNSKVGTLAYEPNEDKSTKIGDEIADAKLEVIFESHVTATSKPKYDINPGDKCTPEEIDYRHSDFRSVREIKITELSKRAASKLGLKKGQSIKMACKESVDTPITCPATGRYSKDDLE